MTLITFLGTGGGRFVTFYQLRATGGIYIQDSLNIHIDPGPGALVQLKKAHIDSTATDLLLVSHIHTDHSSDAGILIEAMTRGGLVRRGKLLCSRSLIEQCSLITPYHKKLIAYTILENGKEVTVKDIIIKAIKTYHNDPTAVGFKIHTKNGVISYVSDTAYSPQLHKQLANSRMLILAVTRPLHSEIPYHLSTETAAQLIKEVRPELAILTHFGFKFLKSNPVTQVKYIQNRTTVKTVAAKDFMKIYMEKNITIF